MNPPKVVILTQRAARVVESPMELESQRKCGSHASSSPGQLCDLKSLAKLSQKLPLPHLAVKWSSESPGEETVENQGK